MLQWVIVALCLPFLSVAQEPADSLFAFLQEARTARQNERAAYFAATIANVFYATRRYDSSLHYYRLSLQFSPPHAMAQNASSSNGLGAVFDKMGQPDSSIKYYDQALAIYATLKDTANWVIVGSNLSAIYMTKGMYDKSLEYAFQSMEVLESGGASRALASCYNTVATVYLNTGDLLRSLEYHRKALRVRREIGYARGVGISYGNMGDTFARLRQYDSALTFLLLAVKIKDSLGDDTSPALNNLAEVYIELGKLGEARNALTGALKINEAQHNLLGQIENLNNLGKVAFAGRDYTSCERYLLRAETLLRDVDAWENLRDNKELWVALCKQKGNYERALFYTEELLEVKDKIMSKEKAESLALMQVRYETERKENQIVLLERDKALRDSQLELNQVWIRLLIGGAVLLGIIVLLIWNQFKMSQKGKEKVEMLLKELNHRVKNNLQILSSILTLQSQQLEDPTAIDAIKSSEGRINAMALIHRKLYGGEPGQPVNLKDYVGELVGYLAQTFGNRHRKIDLKLDLADVNLIVDKAIPLGLVLNELVTNAFKYALVDQPEPKLTVSLCLRHGVDLLIQIKDNGPGMGPQQDSNLPSFGLKMVNILMKELQGKMTIVNEAGTQIELLIPYPV
jgi:two-component sensor histidine kinase/Flp pilus assembly protein TadD